MSSPMVVYDTPPIEFSVRKYSHTLTPCGACACACACAWIYICRVEYFHVPTSYPSQLNHIFSVRSTVTTHDVTTTQIILSGLQAQVGEASLLSRAANRIIELCGVVGISPAKTRQFKLPKLPVLPHTGCFHAEGARSAPGASGICCSICRHITHCLV